MRETQERRRLIREHMANLKKQRVLDAERAAMAREEVLTQTFAQEERRCDAYDGPSFVGYDRSSCLDLMMTGLSAEAFVALKASDT